jgi:uncharacterized protein YacL
MKVADGNSLLVITLRATFLVLVIGTVSLTLAAARTDRLGLPTPTIIGTLMAAVAAASLVLIADVMTPKKHLASVLGIYIGVSVGLVAALGFAALIDIVAAAWELTNPESLVYLGLAKGVAGISLVYLSVSVVLSTKDDFRVVIPYVQFERRAQGVMPLLLDTSAIIDGRVVDLARTGILDAPIVIQRFVIDELQALADSRDRNKRERGRRGLDLLSRLQEVYAETRISDTSLPDPGEGVDRKLIQTAQLEGYRIVTTDSGLTKVAQIQDVPVMNINDVAGSLRQNILPGVRITVEVSKKGEGDRQGIGYMPDGTMLVIEDGEDHIGSMIEVEITNTLQRGGSRLVFARPTTADTKEPKAQMGRSATTQDPVRERPDRDPEDPPSPLPRNPRRNR